jgi:hypothetical protein
MIPTSNSTTRMITNYGWSTSRSPKRLLGIADHVRFRGRRHTSSHQRKSVCVKGLVGASSVVCPCIAVMGLGPTACNRVVETTGGAAHDVRRDHVCLNAAEGSPRPPAWAGRDDALLGRDRRLPAVLGSVNGDVGVPGSAGGDDRVQLP